MANLAKRSPPVAVAAAMGHVEGLDKWARILAFITGTVDQELLLRNESWLLKTGS